MKSIEISYQFKTTTNDESWRERRCNDCIWIDQQGCFIGNLTADSDLAGHNRALRLLAGRIDRSIDQHPVQTCLLHHEIGSGWPTMASASARAARLSCSVVVQSGSIRTITLRIFLVSRP